MLFPRSVAVVGAGREPGTMGHDVLQQMLVHGFKGPVYPVNHKADVVAGLAASPTVADLPGEVDLAIIAVPAAEVAAVVDDCARKGVRALIVLSAGFADAGAGGAEAERSLVARARANGMRLLGPNCMGAVNTAPEVRLHATFAP